MRIQLLKTTTVLICAITLLTTFSCNKDDNGDNNGDDNSVTNTAPGAFNLIGVSDNAVSVDILPEFRWETAIDMEGDDVTYSLFLGIEEDPSTLYADNISSTGYTTTEILLFGTTYYWKIIATDAQGATTTSETYTFTTRDTINLNVNAITDNADFSPRNNHASVVFQNKLWVIGGTDISYKNDVWSSPDGITWTEETAAAPFSGRRFHTSVVFDDKIWVIGGDGQQGFKNDVWSSADGVTWTEETAAAPFSARSQHTSVVFDNKIWVIGGDDGAQTNDVWSSSDGVTWTEVNPDAAFSRRFGHTTDVLNDVLVLIGGAVNGSTVNDAWFSDNGADWLEADVITPFSARFQHTSVIFNNNPCIIAGAVDNENLTNDIWYPATSSSWSRPAPFSARTGHTSVVFNNKIWVIGGFDGRKKNDVWAFN